MAAKAMNSVPATNEGLKEKMTENINEEPVQVEEADGSQTTYCQQNWKFLHWQ